jgi:hypothetical protein
VFPVWPEFLNITKSIEFVLNSSRKIRKRFFQKSRDALSTGRKQLESPVSLAPGRTRSLQISLSGLLLQS